MHHAALDLYQLDLICNGTDHKIIKKSNLIAIQLTHLFHALFANLGSSQYIYLENNIFLAHAF